MCIRDSFDTEEAALKAVLKKKYKKGDVIVIRYEGPKGGPGMRECCRQLLQYMDKEWEKKLHS